MHFETSPYIPYGRLDEKTKAVMDSHRETLRKSVGEMGEINGLEKKPIREMRI
ncbi:hypothetical protein [Peptoclostridium litorale]|uniref:hypothetical protein n=1 Tax=Peptoclostridium litorale TaxID=1557 RepID=UPI0013562D0E|nr:hypothetical protein [Peptoclostridium litorale]